CAVYCFLSPLSHLLLHDTPTPELYTLSLHDALPIFEHMLFKGTPTRSAKEIAREFDRIGGDINAYTSKEYTCYYAKVVDDHAARSEEHTSELQSRENLVCRLLLEKKKDEVLPLGPM